MRYELSECEWAAIKPMLPNKPRGVPRVNDRRVLNGVIWVLLRPGGKPRRVFSCSRFQLPCPYGVCRWTAA